MNKKDDYDLAIQVSKIALDSTQTNMPIIYLDKLHNILVLIADHANKWAKQHLDSTKRYEIVIHDK